MPDGEKTYPAYLVNAKGYSELLMLEFLSKCVSHSVVSDSATLWTVARQAPLFMGFLQAIILEWIAMLCSRGSSPPRDWTQVSCTAGGFFTVWATKIVKPFSLQSKKYFTMKKFFFFQKCTKLSRVKSIDMYQSIYCASTICVTKVFFFLCILLHRTSLITR